ncbi:MAG: ATP-binding protein, partial [Planctomycetota bacterium]
NLVVNARDAMPSGGKLSVRLDSRHLSSVRPLLIEERDHRVAVVTVEDTGTGIDRAVLDHIFDPFFTTKERGQGTGLGMSIVHGIITEHGGDVLVDSQVGGGTIVRLVLPLCAPTAGSPLPTPRLRTTPKTSIRVLLVEDNEQVREVLSQALRGFDLVEAADGRSALERFREQDPDVAILDVDLPRVSGLACLEEFRAVRPDFPAIVMSGFPIDDAVSSRDRTRILQKPFDPRTLVETLNELLDGSSEDVRSSVSDQVGG